MLHDHLSRAAPNLELLVSQLIQSKNVGRRGPSDHLLGGQRDRAFPHRVAPALAREVFGLRDPLHAPDVLTAVGLDDDVLPFGERSRTGEREEVRAQPLELDFEDLRVGTGGGRTRRRGSGCRRGAYRTWCGPWFGTRIPAFGSLRASASRPLATRPLAATPPSLRAALPRTVGLTTGTAVLAVSRTAARISIVAHASSQAPIS